MSTYKGHTIDSVVIALFAAKLRVNATEYADQPAIEIDTGSTSYNLKICFLAPDCVLVKHQQMPGRDYIIEKDIVTEFFNNESSIALSGILVGPEFDSFKDAIEAGSMGLHE